MTIDAAHLGLDTRLTLLAAGLVFLWALALGVWKYHGIMTSPDHQAHVYVDIAHRAALLYSFALLLTAVFVQLSAWPQWVDLTAAAVLTFFFAAAIGSYCWHGARRDTDNQFAPPAPGVHGFMLALIVAEIGAFAVLLAGFVAGW
ncbi:hypothetical protein [Tsukamurella pseudospumae]|uniref:Integral membrane protein n=1 Tax=Tsukamurella pseudospumae TaxID=239498 RepID=A0A138AIY6_9ACTN|nr:hypothetical protein [Tsukamurella pseudospumae]KXP00065.1 hypothetical protein AXK61_15830 [Tsukamurella pseudospumae]KXP10325.1 hypothetical protein AXK60_07655 [Tsukamurella pseudospumae]